MNFLKCGITLSDTSVLVFSTDLVMLRTYSTWKSSKSIVCLRFPLHFCATVNLLEQYRCDKLRYFQVGRQWSLAFQKIWAFGIYPGDFVTKVKQINSQAGLISMSSFAGPSYLTIRSSVFVFWHLLSTSLYFQSLQCLPNLILLHTLETSPMFTSFQWINDKTNSLQLQPSIRPAPAQVTSKYFTVEKATKTLHQMSPCTLVSVPAKIIWIHRLAELRTVWDCYMPIFKMKCQDYESVRAN